MVTGRASVARARDAATRWWAEVEAHGTGASPDGDAGGPSQ